MIFLYHLVEIITIIVNSVETATAAAVIVIIVVVIVVVAFFHEFSDSSHDKKF